MKNMKLYSVASNRAYDGWTILAPDIPSACLEAECIWKAKGYTTEIVIHTVTTLSELMNREQFIPRPVVVDEASGD